MSVNLWWAHNDGMTGHAWLGGDQLRLLCEEMLLQGMAQSLPLEKLEPTRDGRRITPQEIEGALALASPEPLAITDRKLWEDWLAFLEGARHKGGLLVR